MLFRIILVFALVVPALSSSAQDQPPPPTQVSPPPDAPPIPDTRLLLLEVERNQKAAETARADYTYHVQIEQEELDGKGLLKKTITSDYESLTVKTVRVLRAVARNGQPLTPDEARKENERIDKEVARDLERRAKRESKDQATDNRGDELISASRFLELGVFSNPRRVDLNDRPTIVVDYAGDPKAKTHNPGEGIVRDLVGTIWVDEASRAMVRAEGHFLNDFKLYGGLALSIHKGFSFSFRAVHVNNAVWLPEAVTAQGSGRYLLFFSINGRFRLKTSDYRRFRTTSTITGTNGIIDENGNPIPEVPPQEEFHAPTTAPKP